MTLFDSACASLPNRQSDKWWCRPRREEAGDGEREASRRCFSRRESKVALRTQAWLWSSCMLDGLNRNCQCKSVEPISAGYITPIHNVLVFRAVPHMWVVNFSPSWSIIQKVILEGAVWYLPTPTSSLRFIQVTKSMKEIKPLELILLCADLIKFSYFH